MRLDLLQSWLDDDPTLKVLVGGDHDRSGLGKGNAVPQWERMYTNGREAHRLFVEELDKMIQNFGEHNNKEDIRVRYGRLTNNPEERERKREIVVWGANASNYNLPTGTMVEGGKQAAVIGLASVWEYGIITTPAWGLPPIKAGAQKGPPPAP